MTADHAIPKPQAISLPDIPALCVSAGSAVLLTTEGEIQTLPHSQATQAIRNQTLLVCHAPYTKSRLGFEEFHTFDVLELFAFIHPARFCVPTPAGLARALNCAPPASFEDYPFTLIECAQTLLRDLQNDPYAEKADPLKISAVMGLKGKGWGWTPFIHTALGEIFNPEEEIFSKSALNVWKHLPEWANDPPEAQAAHEPVTQSETEERLAELLNVGDSPAEIRTQQKDYANAIRPMFAPMREDENPHIVLAEAGTGVGKTLGYLAPASVWAEKNDGAVWISTYTKNLQRQIDSELDRLYPHPVVKDAYVSIRKGRENYLCLLNLDEAAAGAALTYTPRHAIAAGIMARWVGATKDGDLSGAQFPGWLAGILGYANTYGLADKRGECIYSACDHYQRCFVERSIRKAKRARLVIANHALVMIQSATSSAADTMPTRYIFDEGHHLFDAADSAFAAHLTARETAELRRWILGHEDGRKKRARGLKRRIEDVIEGDQDAQKHLGEIIYRANILCAQNWSHRLKDKTPQGPCEEFLMHIHRVVHARAQGTDTPYSIETELFPLDEDILSAAKELQAALIKLLKPISALGKHLHQRIANDKGEMESDMRKRLDTLSNTLEQRGTMTLTSWIAMLETLKTATPSPGFVDWLEVERIDGKGVDVGLYRHYVDPMKPFASSIRPHVHGMGVTSATLQDRTDDDVHNWSAAQTQTGANYLSAAPHQSSFASPFDYAQNTRVFIINDVNKNDLAQVSGAYQALFEASGGGALGLFTAIQRLRAVYDKISLPLEQSGIPLYGQHIETIDTGTLIDMFREEENACLLGTDAVRDGVDVPGRSLRLLVFDRVPWPRPNLLHKARRKEFGGRAYDEMLTRLKLKQAFGRLTRRASDKGVFVMLDPMLPTRLQSAFPQDVQIIKTGLKDTITQVRGFLE